MVIAYIIVGIMFALFVLLVIAWALWLTYAFFGDIIEKKAIAVGRRRWKCDEDVNIDDD